MSHCTPEEFIVSYGTYSTTDKRCATCRFWEGPRQITFNKDKPFRVKATSGSYKCAAFPSKSASAVNRCQRFMPWEKL